MVKGKTAVVLSAMALICGLTVTGCHSGASKTEGSSSSSAPQEITSSAAGETQESMSAAEEPAATASQQNSSDAEISASASTESETPKTSEAEGSGKKNKSPYSLKGTYLGSYSAYDQTTVLAYIDGTKLVLYTEDFKKFQELDIQTTIDEKDYAKTATSYFNFADANFDSFSDISIIDTIDGENLTYNYYFWNEDQQKYVYNKEMSQVVSPMLMDNQHVIKSHRIINETDSEDYSYEWSDDKLITTSFTSVKYNSKTKKYTIKTKTYDENGKLISSKTKKSDTTY